MCERGRPAVASGGALVPQPAGLAVPSWVAGTGRGVMAAAGRGSARAPAVACAQGQDARDHLAGPGRRHPRRRSRHRLLHPPPLHLLQGEAQLW